jgi:excisionase family DNA binding protein
MYTVDDLCKRYGVTEGTVLAWIKSGALSALNVGRRLGAKKPRWRVSPEALAAFESARTPAAQPPRGTRRKRQGEVIAFY